MNPNNHEINNLTKQLNRLRLQRQDFYPQVNAEEERILDRLRQANASSHSIVPSPRRCENGSNNRPARRIYQEASSVQTPVDLPDLRSINRPERRIHQEASSVQTPVDLPDLVPSEVPSRVARAPTTHAYRTVTAPRDLNVGDRVKILNKIRFVSGRPTDKDRLATVIRKTNFYIHLVTDSGYTTSRAPKNILQVLEDDEQPSQSQTRSGSEARARSNFFLDL